MCIRDRITYEIKQHQLPRPCPVAGDVRRVKTEGPELKHAYELSLIHIFKVREGMPVGAKVTLRGEKMWEFLDRLFNVALPRVRDFRGINPNSFDGRGNYAFGLKEQLIFPEIEYDKVDKIRGMDICICTTATTDEEAKELLTMVGAPFYLSLIHIWCLLLV